MKKGKSQKKKKMSPGRKKLLSTFANKTNNHMRTYEKTGSKKVDPSKK